MNTKTDYTLKLKYSEPKVERIILDNNISLQLVSEPPLGPGESDYGALNSDYFNSDPFKNDLV